MKLMLLLAIFLLPCVVSYRTSPSDQFIYDNDNRVSFFHGENFVQKGFPWYPEVLLNLDNIKEMKSWGFNTVRLGVMWSGVEPELGVYNETYLEVINGILDDLKDNGFHTLIDVHQDVLSSYFCEYDGAPTWLIDLSDSCAHDFPYPLAWDGENKCDRPWGMNYLAEATGAAFQDLYDNRNGMRDHFGKFWSKVATSFKDRDELLGYEIINEPWVGNHIQDPSLLLPGKAGAKSLQPFYDIISENIRESDPNKLIFYEPVTWGMIFNGSVMGSGFSQVPGGDKYRGKSVFSFHYYCWWYTGEGNLEKVTCDDMFGNKVFDQVSTDIQQLGGSAMLTEWGQGCEPYNGNDGECQPIMNLADDHLLSWIEWYWSGRLMNGWDTDAQSISTFSRTFAQVVAGIPTKMHFNSKSLDFELCYDVDVDIVAPTIIYLNNAVHYVHGVMVHVSGEYAPYMHVMIGDADSNTIEITSSKASSDVMNKNVCVYISHRKGSTLTHTL